jgi:hypothetical protein
VSQHFIENRMLSAADCFCAGHVCLPKIVI